MQGEEETSLRADTAAAAAARVVVEGPEVRVRGLRHAAGRFIRLRAQVEGASPTTIRIKAWAEGTPEPPDWQFVTTDGAEVLQAAGAVGVQAFLSFGGTNAPVTFSFDDLLVATPPMR